MNLKQKILLSVGITALIIVGFLYKKKINKSLGEKVLDVAKSQVGKSENPKGSNWGDTVKKYLNSVGLNFASPWCASFVYWCYNQVTDKNPLIKTGSVLKHWNDADKKYKVTNPKKGDIFIMDFGGGKGHTGIVEGVDTDNIYTIEGNSNIEGSPEGTEVLRRKRLKKSIKGYLRYA